MRKGDGGSVGRKIGRRKVLFSYEDLKKLHD